MATTLQGEEEMLPPNLEPRLFLVAPQSMGRECARILSEHEFEPPLVFPDLCAALKATLSQTPDLLLVEAELWEQEREILFHLRALQLDVQLPVLLLASPAWKAANWSLLLDEDIECLALPLRVENLVPRVHSLLRTRQLSASSPRTADELDAEAEKEASSARLESIVTQLQSGILVVDQNRRVVLTNPEFCRIFGIEKEPDALIGLDSWRVAAQTKHLLSPGTSTVWDRIEEIVSRRESVLGEEIALSDGRTLSRDCAPIFCRGRYMGHIWSYRDVSERTNFERESLRKRDSALQSAKFQAEFLANMSHEIRTPINGVLGMLGLLADTPLGADQRGLLQTAQTSADALLHIINDILDFSKVKAGKLHIEDGVYTPIAVLDDCLQTVISTAHDKGLELLSIVEPDVPSGVRGDGARVRQVLTNLLSNAIKFTHRGEIVITIERSDSIGAARAASAGDEASQSQFLRYRVRDSGIGMSADSQKNLFQPFTQADGSTTRRYGGTGLGLAICKQLVERMGGQIGVESGDGKGSMFWFTLPLVPVEIADERGERELIVALSDARVLVVEDNATIRRFLLQQLGSWHINSDGARTGAEAMHRLRSAARAGHAYDVALLDAQLPDADAVSLAHEIKNDGLLSRTDLLLMTALNAALPDNSAFAGTVSKPVRQSQLHDALLQLFGGEPLRRATDAQPSRREERDFGGVRILLADDNAINREVALRWLQKWNCQTTSVADGREAVDALQKHEFDLVFMDCQMPELDGYEATRAIRSGQGAARDVPIIAVTAHAMQGDRQKCLDAGMTDYLPKPIRPDGLAEMIERWTKITPPMVAPSAVPLPKPKPAPETEIVPVLPPILDEQTLRELHEAVGDEEFPQFVEMFYEQSSESERLLRDAAEQNDCDALACLAHSLKGVSRQYGAVDVALACEELEVAAKNHNCAEGINDFSPQIDAIRRVLLAARVALHQTANAILAGDAPAS